MCAAAPDLSSSSESGASDMVEMEPAVQARYTCMVNRALATLLAKAGEGTVALVAGARSGSM